MGAGSAGGAALVDAAEELNGMKRFLLISALSAHLRLGLSDA